MVGVKGQGWTWCGQGAEVDMAGIDMVGVEGEGEHGRRTNI